MILRLTDGTVTVNLHGTSPVVGCTYRPLPPDVSATRHAAAGLDGERLSAADYRNVTEEAAVVLEGTAANIQSTVTTVERLFAQARDRHNAGMGARVYVEYQAHSGDDTYRAEVMYGRVVWPEEAVRRSLEQASNTVEVRLLWERRWYWEGPEATLQFVNQNALTTPINSISIQNGSGGTNGNTAQVYAVAGDIPTTPKVTITNAAGAAVWFYRGWLWGDAHIGLTAAQHHIADADSSSWGAGGTNHSLFPINIAIPDATIAKIAGRPVRLLGVFGASLSSALYVRANIQHYVNPLRLRLREGNEVYIAASGAQIVDLGAFPLPPGGYTATTGVEVGISVYDADSGSINMSFLQLAPADNVRVLRQDGFQLENGDAWVDDPVEGVCYVLDGSARWPILRSEGPPVRLWPGKTNYLRFLLQEQGAFNSGRAFTVAATYRPRRLTL